MSAKSLCVGFIMLLTVSATAAAEDDKKFPDLPAVKAAVQSSLAARKGYRVNDLISQGDVARALKAVEKLGWKVKDGKSMQSLALADSDDLVRQLRTKQGTAFMRKLSGTPETFDRMDRLRKLPYGQRRIRELIRNPGGHTLILYMTNTKGGKNLGGYLRRTKQGKGFNKTTGRIYTEKDLIDRLQSSHAVVMKNRKKTIEK